MESTISAGWEGPGDSVVAAMDVPALLEGLDDGSLETSWYDLAKNRDSDECVNSFDSLLFSVSEAGD